MPGTGTLLASKGRSQVNVDMSLKSTVMVSTLGMAVVAATLWGCFGPSDSDRVGEIKSDLVLLIEGKDRNALIRHCPDDISDIKISMESGHYIIVPESLDELEEALDEFRSTFNGERVETTQENVDIEGDTARVSMTFRVTDEGWERILPVRMDIEREADRWVLHGLHVFD